MGDGLSGGYLPAGPDFSSSGAVAASLPFSQAGWGCLLFRSLRAAGFLPSGAVRNISVFSNGAENTPHPAWEKGRLAAAVPEEEKSGPAGRYPPDRPSPHTAPRETQGHAGLSFCRAGYEGRKGGGEKK